MRESVENSNYRMCRHEGFMVAPSGFSNDQHKYFVVNSVVFLSRIVLLRAFLKVYYGYLHDIVSYPFIATTIMGSMADRLTVILRMNFVVITNLSCRSCESDLRAA